MWVRVQHFRLHCPWPKGLRLVLHAVVYVAYRSWLAALRGLRAREVGKRRLSEVLMGSGLSAPGSQDGFSHQGPLSVLWGLLVETVLLSSRRFSGGLVTHPGCHLFLESKKRRPVRGQ